MKNSQNKFVTYFKYYIIFILSKILKNNYSLKRKELLLFFIKFNKKNKLDIHSIYGATDHATKHFLKIKKKIINYSNNYNFLKIFTFKRSKNNISKTELLGSNKRLNFIKTINFSQSKSYVGQYKNIKIHNWHGFPIVFYDNKIIKKISSKYAPLSISKEILTTKEKKINTGFLLFSDVDIQNYCHFILDVFSMTYFLKKINNKKIIILLPKFNLSKYHNFFFKIIKKSGYKIYFMDQNESILVKNFYAIEDFYHPVGLVNKYILNYLRFLVNSNTKIQKKILWITRTKRRVLNEKQIVERLKINYSVTIVDLEKISVAEQINLFNKHEVYIGPHGAGFTNIVFINSVYKRKLIEIFPEDLGTPTYCMISSSQNIKHYSYVGKSIRTFQSNYSNILVNEKEFLDLAKKII
jgi:hypothetical protein